MAIERTNHNCELCTCIICIVRHVYHYATHYSIHSCIHGQDYISAIPSMASARIQCWALLLSGYDYTISYKPGPDNANADMLSRLPSSPPPPNIPTPTETVLLLEALDSSPITYLHIRQWTAKDPTLAKVRDSVSILTRTLSNLFIGFCLSCILNTTSRK